jgi:hypothetical protein
LVGGLVGVGDNFDHEAVRIEEEGGETMRAISRVGLRCTHYLVAAIPSPLVDKVHVISRRNEERQVLKSDVV